MIKYISEQRDWDDLLKYIAKGKLTPIIGKEMYKFKQDDKLIPIDEHLSKQLLAEFDVTDQPSLTLPEAVSYLNKEKEIEPIDIRGRLDPLVEDIKGKEFPLLSAFLSISELQYYINTALYDNVLVDIFKNVRKEGANSITPINFSIQRSLKDSNALQNLNEPFIFNVFGSLVDTVDPALTEEDLLEYTWAFKEKIDNTPNIKDALKTQQLLFLGCAFPDWMVRYILRLLSIEPLHDWGRIRRIYIINDQTDLSNRQTSFLENYKVITYKGNTLDFVNEISGRWQKSDQEKKKKLELEETEKLEEEKKKTRQAEPKMIFLSYTRVDEIAVKTLKGSLEKIDNVTCFYDKDNIQAGDVFNSEIQYNIRKADLFIPLISANSLTHKGVVQDEWRSAVNEEGVRKLVGKNEKFLIPIVIDDSDLYDPNLPAYFSGIDIKPVRNGNPDEKFINTIKTILKLN